MAIFLIFLHLHRFLFLLENYGSFKILILKECTFTLKATIYLVCGCWTLLHSEPSLYGWNVGGISAIRMQGFPVATSGLCQGWSFSADLIYATFAMRSIPMVCITFCKTICMNYLCPWKEIRNHLLFIPVFVFFPTKMYLLVKINNFMIAAAICESQE